MNHTDREINAVWRLDIKVGREFSRDEAAKFSSWSRNKTIQLRPTSQRRAKVSQGRDLGVGAVKPHVRHVTNVFVYHRKSI